jgi:hypothetical protein
MKALRARLRQQLSRIGSALGFALLRKEIQETKMLAAKTLIRQLNASGMQPAMRELEFKVFSQFGDDGIIQYLIRHVNISHAERVFIEFGVENYEEANTRFLLLNDNWRGLIIDGDAENIRHVQKSDLYWRNDLTAVSAFIDRDNVNQLFQAHGFSGGIGLLSIDIDGNDLWVWKAIDTVSPVIVIVEYNAVFGSQYAVTIPYDPVFERARAHYSNLYWGCSLKALCLVGEEKGYAFVGCNSAGNNAYFIRKDRIGSLRAVTANEGFVPSRFRESRGPLGELTYSSGQNRFHLISDLEVFDIEHNQLIKVAGLC